MALKEKLEEVTTELGLEYIRSDISRDHLENGVPSWLISVDYFNEGKHYQSTWTIAKQNGMSEDEIATVVKSYLNAENFLGIDVE